MPFERIHHEKVDVDSVEVSVHWNKRGGMPGWVQIQTQKHIAPRCNCAGNGTCCTSPYCRGGRADLPASSEPDLPAHIVTEVFSRSEVNELIRVLRRARDQAYGRDE